MICQSCKEIHFFHLNIEFIFEWILNGTLLLRGVERYNLAHEYRDFSAVQQLGQYGDNHAHTQKDLNIHGSAQEEGQV